MKRGALIGVVATALVVTGLASAGPDALRFSMTLQVVGPGTVAVFPGGKCPGYLTRVHTCRLVYAGGTRVRLTAVPRVNAKLSSWRGSVTGRVPTRTVTMNSPKLVTATFVKVAPPKPKPPPPPGNSRANPVPLGATVTVTSLDEKWAVRITSTQPDATAAVLAENQFNDPPAAGKQFFIATLAVTYLSGTKPDSVSADFSLRSVGPSNVVYTTFGNSCGVIPDDIDSKGQLLPGGSKTGNVCWEVPSSEAASLIAFWDTGDKPIWMALR
jgi:Divergent InlB B-repeat domain